MFQMSLDDIVAKIKQSSGKTESEITTMITKKVEELNNLVSKEGAAHIVANELGVKLLDDLDKKDIQIKNLLPGLRSVNVIGRVTRVFPVKEWEKGERKGKVGSFVITDGTGTSRVVLWNDQTDMLEKEVKLGVILRITSAFVKEGNFGPELHLRDKSKIEFNPEGVTIDAPERKRVKISEIEPDQWVTFRAAVVDYIKRDPFFEVCPECGKRVRESEKFKCPEHGEVKPKYSAALNIILDDGTGNVKAVFFGKNVESFIGMNLEEFHEKNFEEEMVKQLGKEFIFFGKSGLNTFSGETEVVVREVEPSVSSEESKLVIEELDIWSFC